MKAFFEEYGFVLVAIIVVMALVAIVPKVSGTVGTYLEDMPYKMVVGSDENTDMPTLTFNPDNTKTTH